MFNTLKGYEQACRENPEPICDAIATARGVRPTALRLRLTGFDDAGRPIIIEEVHRARITVNWKDDSST